MNRMATGNSARRTSCASLQKASNRIIRRDFVDPSGRRGPSTQPRVSKTSRTPPATARKIRQAGSYEALWRPFSTAGSAAETGRIVNRRQVAWDPRTVSCRTRMVPRSDSNRQGVSPLTPQASASTNSATSALKSKRVPLRLAGALVPGWDSGNSGTDSPSTPVAGAGAAPSRRLSDDAFRRFTCGRVANQARDMLVTKKKRLSTAVSFEKNVAETGRAEHGARGSGSESGAGHRRPCPVAQDECHDREAQRPCRNVIGFAACRHVVPVRRSAFGAAQMLPKSSAFSEAPPIKPPSTYGHREQLRGIARLDAAPYRTRRKRPCSSFSRFCPGSGRALPGPGPASRFPVPIAQTGS